VNFNVVLPFLSSTLSFVFFLFLVDQWRDRRKPYQAIWAAGMLWYALSAGTEWIGGAFGWSEPLYRLWYLIGAIWVAGWLGLGTVYLLGRTRFGYAFAFSLFLAGLFTFLTQAKYDYPQSGIAPVLYFLVAMLLAAGVVVLSFRRSARWPALAAAAIVGGSVVSAAMVARVTLPAPGWVVDPVTHIPTGDLFPGYIRLLTPFFNITGAFALSLGAIYSAYVFMPNTASRPLRASPRSGRRLLRAQPPARPGRDHGQLRRLPARRVPGPVRGQNQQPRPRDDPHRHRGIIPAITSGMNRFGATSGFFVGELLGVVFLFAGFLVSIEVFREVRVPFTAVVLWNRRAEEAS